MRRIKHIAFSAFVLALVAISGNAQAQSQTQTKSRAASQKPVSADPVIRSGDSRPMNAHDMHDVTSPEFRRSSTSNFKWDAFIDVEGRIPNKDTLSDGKTPALADRGFSLNDAALYMTKDWGSTKALVDLPFYSDLAGGNNFAFASGMSEAYIQIDRWSPMSLRLGQYESYLGVEKNASRDRFIADMGAIKTYLLPLTHTGVQAAYGASALTLRGQVADPNGSNTMSNSNPELGLGARFDQGPGYGSFGFTYNDGKPPAGGQITNMIFDFMGGIDAGKVHADAEIVIKKTAGIDKTANGFGIFGAFPMSDALALGGRFEYLKDAPTAAGKVATFDSLTAFSFGPSYRLQQDLVLRGDFSLANSKVAGGTSDDTIFGLTVSVVADL